MFLNEQHIIFLKDFKNLVNSLFSKAMPVFYLTQALHVYTINLCGIMLPKVAKASSTLVVVLRFFGKNGSVNASLKDIIKRFPALA